jgi:hypothetical protein
MKRFLILLILFASLISCEKSKDDSEKGQLLFYTNSYLINCPFNIELSINGDKIGFINASTNYSNNNCNCDDSIGIGLLLNLKVGSVNYSANEVECVAINKINSWTGAVNITKDSCTVVFLDIIP